MASVSAGTSAAMSGPPMFSYPLRGTGADCAAACIVSCSFLPAEWFFYRKKIGEMREKRRGIMRGGNGEGPIHRAMIPVIFLPPERLTESSRLAILKYRV